LSLVAAVGVLLVTMIKRGLYTAVLIGVLAPLMLATILYSIPDATNLLVDYTGLEKPVLLVANKPLGGKCYPGNILSGLVAAGDTVLEARVLGVRADADTLLGELGLTGGYNERSGLVVPMDMYNALGRVSTVKLVLNNTVHEYRVAGSWRASTMLLVDPGLVEVGVLYVCLEPRSEYAAKLLEHVEDSLLATTGSWVLLLLFAYTPVVYASQRRVVESLRGELEALYNTGLSVARLFLSVYAGLVVLSALAALYAVSVGVVLVYTTWSLLGFIAPIPQPVLRSEISFCLLTAVSVFSATALLACRGVLGWH